MLFRSIFFLLVGCALLTAPLAAIAADRGPSTPEERKQALDYIHDLEVNPLGPQAKDETRWLLNWLGDIPDVTVHVCVILDKLPKPDKKDAASIFFAEMSAQAAYLLENPDKRDDRQAELLAGIQGALRVYEVLLKSNPKDRQTYLDALIQRRDAGTLGDFVKERAAQSCKN